MHYHSLKLLLKKIILIDGISRTGKLLTGSLVSSFKNSEHLEFGTNFEHFCPGIYFKKIDKHYAKSYITNYLNELIYNKYLSRNVNFRPTDRTGVPNSISLNTYKKRLKAKEGDGIVKLINKQNKQVPFITHDLLININALNELDINYQMIQIFRNPINLVMSWYKRGLGSRYGKDQRMFTLLINKKDNIYPWYDQISGINNNKNANELERCINYVYYLTKKSIVNYKNLNSRYKKKIFISTYESIVGNTLEELKKIKKFLNLKITNSTLKFIKKEKCPKQLDKDKLEQNRKYIKLKVKKIFYDRIISFKNKFNNNIYNILK